MLFVTNLGAECRYMVDLQQKLGNKRVAKILLRYLYELHRRSPKVPLNITREDFMEKVNDVLPHITWE